VAASDDVLLKASKTEGSPAALIFIPGAELDPSTYIPNLKALQDAANFPLHICK
jgi:hypothetical protein